MHLQMYTLYSYSAKAFFYNITIQNGLLPIHIAAALGHVEILKYLGSLSFVSCDSKTQQVCFGDL